LLRVFGCHVHFHVKEGKFDPRKKKFVFLDVKRNLKGYKLWDNKNKKFAISMDVTFDEASMLRPNSQQVESMKTKKVSQRVEDDATPHSPVGSVSFEISLNVTPDGDHVVILYIGHVKKKVVYLI